MRSLLIAAIVLCVSAMSTHAQDYASYESLSVDELVERAEKGVGGTGAVGGAQLISPAAELAIEGEVNTVPYRCSSNTLMRFMSMAGFPIDELPVINYCIEMLSKTEVVTTFYIPESLAVKMGKEVRVGDELTLWSRWVYTIEFSKRPYLLLDAYKLSPAGEAGAE